MSSFSNRDSQVPTSRDAPSSQNRSEPFPKYEPTRRETAREPPTQTYNMDGSSSQPRTRERASSRPMSMVQTYQPPLMDVNQDTLPELQPIFTFLNSHANKLYQEGYFLKLDDQNTRMYIPPRSPTFLINNRWQGQRGSNMDRMLCTTCRNSTLVMGCCGIGCCWPRWRGAP